MEVGIENKVYGLETDVLVQKNYYLKYKAWLI